MPRGAAPIIDQPKKRKPKRQTEADKIAHDAVAYGTGAFTTDERGEVRHVSLEKLHPPEPEPGPNQVAVTSFDKRAYQREYMRKRRAAARAAKGASND